MDAVVIREFGGPEVLRCESIAVPRSRPGWVTVRLKAAALNWHDVLVRQGKYSSPLPHVLGADGAGVRTDTGEDVLVMPSLWWGSRDEAPGPDWTILGDRESGTYAECVQVPAECCVPKPRGLSWEQAAALPLVGLTVYRALFTRGRLREGERVLVLGAGGGVATMAVLLASAVGAEVTVTSSSREKIDQAVALGARGGVLYTDADWPSAAASATPDGRGFDVVLDSVGTWEQSVTALRPGGRLVVLGASRSERSRLDVRSFYFGQYELIGTTMGSPRDFAGLLKLLADHTVAPVPIAAAFSLDRADQAHRYLEGGTAIGKVVLTMP
ncbi:quinone oxidoreductase family protein [Prescottella agglutinans]|uniref:Zinc-binding alcohol dehydrogenase/oxidoreductase n=1 Tax=Prescottella agglutinans TaxID=1644129 RepID=A0ABT6MKY3_9NOCA|nr:zinc-binding dehydrogenase [Prescottella agglutinans]MDH6284983.1 zinc-binding alcohol dehydrogenase/oxidoreductase [Prescottella agglutinans]